MSKLTNVIRIESTVTLDSTEACTKAMRLFQVGRPQDAAELMVRNEATEIARNFGGQVTDLYLMDATYEGDGVTYKFSTQIDPSYQ